MILSSREIIGRAEIFTFLGSFERAIERLAINRFNNHKLSFSSFTFSICSYPNNHFNRCFSHFCWLSGSSEFSLLMKVENTFRFLLNLMRNEKKQLQDSKFSFDVFFFNFEGNWKGFLKLSKLFFINCLHRLGLRVCSFHLNRKESVNDKKPKPNCSLALKKLLPKEENVIKVAHECGGWNIEKN